MHPSLRHTDHRPWPLPRGRWTWRQEWCDLLFAHWPWPMTALRSLVPPVLEIEECDGTSWVGIVPFRMQGVMRRPLPDVPWVSAFAELNLRLYVVHEGRPGVWFVSLDAANPLAVWAARTFFHLPYFHADMTVESQGDGIQYRSRRRPNGAVAFEGAYRPTSPVYRAKPGSLEHFLTERYCLYAYTSGGALLRTDVHHAPWPLQQAEAAITTNAIAGPQGIQISGAPPLLHFSRHIDVIVWPTARVA